MFPLNLRRNHHLPSAGAVQRAKLSRPAVKGMATTAANLKTFLTHPHHERRAIIAHENYREVEPALQPIEYAGLDANPEKTLGGIANYQYIAGVESGGGAGVVAA